MKKNNTTINKWIAVAILALVTVSPSFALAKNDKSNGNGNKNKNSEKQELKVQVREQENEQEQERNREHASTTSTNKSITKCFQAWGHLIAPGWIKWNGSTTVPDNCVMPFGIGKKFKGTTTNNNATSTPDVTAPVISNLIVTPNRYSANIAWKTDELSDSAVFYGTSTPIDLGTATSNTSNILTKNHSINISGLASSTTYYVVVRSKDSSGNTATSSQISFTTLAPIADTVPPTISNIIATVGSTTINVGWKTNENATTKVYYSTSTPVNLTVSPFVENNTLVTTHLSNISGLSTSTTYFIVLESKDSSGNIQRSDEISILTTSGL